MHYFVQKHETEAKESLLFRGKPNFHLDMECRVKLRLQLKNLQITRKKIRFSDKLLCKYTSRIYLKQVMKCDFLLLCDLVVPLVLI